MLLHHVFGFLDSLGNLHFLFARQERHLAHLLEIHPHRIIQNIELGLGLLFLFFLFRVFFSVLVTIDLRRFDNIDLHSPQPREDEIEFIGVGDPFRQCLV